jgi:hypothetical protein
MRNTSASVRVPSRIKSLSAMLRDSLVVPVTTVAIRKAALASRGR